MYFGLTYTLRRSGDTWRIVVAAVARFRLEAIVLRRTKMKRAIGVPVSLNGRDVSLKSSLPVLYHRRPLSERHDALGHRQSQLRGSPRSMGRTTRFVDRAVVTQRTVGNVIGERRGLVARTRHSARRTFTGS